MKLRRYSKADIEGKVVLVRVDFNVPLKDGEVADSTRIKAALPTIAELIEMGGKVVLASHLGRPKGEVDEGMRLAPVVPHLRDLLNFELAVRGITPHQIDMQPDCIGPEVEENCKSLPDNHIALLENLRFHPGETENDPDFCATLAKNADVYVNDAFGTAHRAHASTEGVAKLLPSFAGNLICAEVEALAKIIENPQRPLTVVLGGAKISGKLEVLEFLIPLADNVLIGGAMANTFQLAQGKAVGKSLVEAEMLDKAREMMDLAGKEDTHFELPQDFVVTDAIKDHTRTGIAKADGVKDEDICVDIGGLTRENFRKVIGSSRTVFWNGPMGVFEVDGFSHGTMAIAGALASLHGVGHTVVGGGESVAAVNRSGLAERIGHVSTGGGASLEFVAGVKLPGIEILKEE